MASWMLSSKLGKRLGQSIVEFAIIASVLVLLMVGMLVFGQLFGWLHTLNNAVRDGARYGSVCPDPDNDRDYDEHIIALVMQRTNSLPNGSSRVVTITSMDSNGNPLPPNTRRRGGFLRVEINYDAPVVPIPGILRNPRRLRAVAIFRVECDSTTTSPPPTSTPTCSGPTCSGATCSGPTCSGATCSGPTCSEPTCSGRTCDLMCEIDTVRGCISPSRQDTCGFTCFGWEPSGANTCGGGSGCNNTSGSRCFP
ncbi:MAG: pilus assembly protein [Armatimonadetes bacterium]|nr:pilus assembly protein [Armatimonadota bacterium]MDW8029053.1 TadE/TadG family type IV pilus assembly protein [Armatimonadota bacterium]